MTRQTTRAPATDSRFPVSLRGVDVDSETRCTHWDEPAVLCGVCRETITAERYLSGGDACPRCGAAFNLGCRDHRHLYFEGSGDSV